MLAACEMSGRVRDAFAARGWEAWSADLLPSETPVRTKVDSSGRGVHRLYVTDAKGKILNRTPPNTHHYQGDVLDLFGWYHPVNLAHWKACDGLPDHLAPLWDLVIAFPPCTDLSLAGARYWKEKRADGRQDEAANFFFLMADAPAPHIAIENPRGDMTRRWRPPDQYVEPWQFGDPLKKKIGLWLYGLPLLTADNPVEPTGRVATGGGSHRTDIAAGRGRQNWHEDSEGRARRGIVRSRTSAQVARAMADQWGSYLEGLYQ